MRVFNVRLAAILLGIAVVLGIGVYVLHSFMVRSNASFFLDESKRAEQRAEEAAKDKKTALETRSRNEAIKYLNWYVGLMPKDYKAMEHLGILLADKAQSKAQGSEVIDRQTFWQAYGTLEKTVRLDPERKAARRRLVALAMLPQVGRYQDAKDHLERFLLVDSPKDPDLLEQLADCQVGLRKFDEAQKSYKKAIENAIAGKRTQATAYSKLAELLRYRLSNPKEADQWMAKLVRVNPKSYKAHYLRAAYLAQAHLDDEALLEACKAKELAPDDVDVLLLAAQCNIAKKKYDNARDCLAHGIKMHPSSILMHMAMSDVESRAGNRDKAVAALRNGIKATDRNPTLLWHLASVLIDGNKLDEARRILDELRTKPFSRPMIDYGDARIEFVQGHWKTALDRLNRVRPVIMDPRDPRYAQYVAQIDYFLAVCYYQLGNREQEVEALRRVLDANPTLGDNNPVIVGAKKLMAGLARQRGDLGDTLKDYLDRERAGQLDPAGRLQLAQLLVINIARQKAGQRNWSPVEKLLDAVEKSLPNSPDVSVVRANILVAQGRAVDAEKLLLKTRDKYPKQFTAWRALVALAIHAKDWEKAEGLLTGSQKALGDTVEVRLLESQYVVLHGSRDARPRLRKLAKNADRFSERERLQLWIGLLGAALQVGDKELGGALAQKIAEKQPNNVQIRQLRFEQAFATGDIAATERALKEMEAVAGQDSYWLYGQALLLYLKARNSKDAGPLWEKALGYLKRARDARKDWSRIPLVEAEIYDRQQKVDLALQSYLEAIELGDRNPAGIQRAVEIFFQSQRYADAHRLLERIGAEQKALPANLMRALAECDLYLGNIARATEEIRQAVPADSKNGADQMWLGQLLGVVGRQAKEQGQSADAAELLGQAEKSLRRAVELEPKLPATWKALVVFYALSDEQDKAEAAIQEVRANVPDKDLPSTLAYCYEIVKNTDAAEEQYNIMLKAAPQDIAVARLVADFYSRTRKWQPAEALLRGILDGKMQAGEVDVTWARRELAKILGSSGKYPDLQKAVNLVEQNLSSPLASVADRQLLAKLTASDPRQGARDKAIGLLESLGTSATPDDRFILARLYRNAGNWIKAGDVLRGLVASNVRDSRYLEFYIDLLLEHNEMSSARSYLDRLEKLAPNSFNTISRKADLLCATNQRPQAFETLKDFVDNVDAQPRDRGLRLRMVAEKLADLAAQSTKPEQASFAAQAIDLAESLFRGFIKENPGRELVLAVFLGRHGKMDEALGILDESLQLCDVDEFSQACGLLLENGKATADQLQRLNKIMKAAEVKFERVPRLLSVMAELRNRQTRYSEAIDIYREILRKAPDDAFAMNNVAVLQALQEIKLDESLKLVNRAMELAGPLGAILDSRATVYIAMTNPEKAIEDMNAAIADQETPVRLFHRAQAYVLAGDNAKAKQDLDAAQKKGLTKDALQPLEVPAFERLRETLQ